MSNEKIAEKDYSSERQSIADVIEINNKLNTNIDGYIDFLNKFNESIKNLDEVYSENKKYLDETFENTKAKLIYNLRNLSSSCSSFENSFYEIFFTIYGENIFLVDENNYSFDNSDLSKNIDFSSYKKNKEQVSSEFNSEDSVSNNEDNKANNENIDFFEYLKFLQNKLLNLINTMKEESVENQANYFEEYIYYRALLDWTKRNYDELFDKYIDFSTFKAKLVELYNSEKDQLKNDLIINSNKLSENMQSFQTDVFFDYDKIRFDFENCILDFQLKNTHDCDEFTKKIFVGCSEKILKTVKRDAVLTPICNTLDEISHNIENISVKNDLSFKIREFIDLEDLISTNGCILINKSSNIDENKIASDIYDELLKDISMQFASKMPGKMFRLAYVSPSVSNFGTFVLNLKNYLGSSAVFDNIINTENSLNNFLEYIVNLIGERQSAYGMGENSYKNFFDYNEKISDNKQQVILIIINNFPSEIRSENLKKIKDIIQYGSNVGIYTIITTEKDVEQSDIYEKDKQLSAQIKSKATYTFEINDDSYSFNGEKIVYPIKSNTFDLMESLNGIKEKYMKLDTKIYLENLFDEEEYLEEKPEFYKKIQLPIGKTGSKITYLSLGADVNSHMIITGTTGSGKSYLLHTLILSTCYNYSPDEVNFYIMDFKDGVELTPYGEDMAMPHIKYMALGDNPENALDILKSLVNKKERINKLFTSCSGNGVSINNIENYNSLEVVKNGTMSKLPHTMIVIDEFQKIIDSSTSAGDECLFLLHSLAQQSRNVGFHLILASQQVPSGGFRNVLKEINTRICLMNNEDTITELIPSVRNRISDLNTDKGQGFLSQAQKDVVLFKGACTEPSDSETTSHSRYKIYKSIMEKYGNYKIDIVKANDIEALDFYNYEDIISEQTENKFNICIGKNQITSEDFFFNFNVFEQYEDRLILLGDLSRSKQIETIMIANILAYKKLFNNNCEVDYVNFKVPKSKKIKDSVLEFSANNQFNLYNYENVNEKIDEIKEIYKQRKNNQDENFDYYPIFMFISSCERFSDLKEIDKTEKTSSDDDMPLFSSFSFESTNSDDLSIEDIIVNGYQYSIFVIPHFNNIMAMKKFFKKSLMDLPLKYAIFEEKYEERQLPDELIRVKNKVLYGKDCMLMINKNTVSKIRMYQKKEEK